MIDSESDNFIVDKRILASKGQRIMNYLIDSLLIYVIIMLFALFAGVIESSLDIDFISSKLQNITRTEGYLLFFFFMYIYYILFEYFKGQTIAKFITKTLVVLQNGSRPNFVTICLRSICRMIPFDGISFLGDSGSGLHDTFSKTFVVKKVVFERSFNTHKELIELGNESINVL